MLMRKLERAQHLSRLRGQRLRLVRIHAPQSHVCKQTQTGRMHTYTVADMSSLTPGSKEIKYTHICPCTNTYSSLSLTSEASAAENRMSLSCCREQQGQTELSEGVGLFAAPMTFSGSPVQLSYISTECTLSQTSHNPLLAHSQNTLYRRCSRQTDRLDTDWLMRNR